MIILAPRKHLFATNLIVFIIIYIMRKCLQLFCIIENKTCRNADCTPTRRCNQPDCKSTTTPPALPVPGTPTDTPPSTPPTSKRGFKFIPDAMRKTMHGFGYGEGHFQIFVEKKERNQPTKSRLNAATAQVKLNPN